MKHYPMLKLFYFDVEYIILRRSIGKILKLMHWPTRPPDANSDVETRNRDFQVRYEGRLRRESAVLPQECCCTPWESAADSCRRRPSGLKTAVTLFSNSPTENSHLVVWYWPWRSSYWAFSMFDKFKHWEIYELSLLESDVHAWTLKMSSHGRRK